MLSEDRFYVLPDNWFVVRDGTARKNYHTGSKAESEELCSLLNALHKEVTASNLQAEDYKLRLWQVKAENDRLKTKFESNTDEEGHFCG